MQKIEDAKDGSILEDQYGDWLRASLPLGGRRGSFGESKVKNLVRDSGKVRGEEKAGTPITVSNTQSPGYENEGEEG